MTLLSTVDNIGVEVTIRATTPSPMRLQRTTCARCALDWEHCHHAAIMHASGETECSGGTCGLAVELHADTLSCDDVTPTCGCGR